MHHTPITRSSKPADIRSDREYKLILIQAIFCVCQFHPCFKAWAVFFNWPSGGAPTGLKCWQGVATQVKCHWKPAPVCSFIMRKIVCSTAYVCVFFFFVAVKGKAVPHIILLGLKSVWMVFIVLECSVWSCHTKKNLGCCQLDDGCGWSVCIWPLKCHILMMSG